MKKIIKIVGQINEEQYHRFLSSLNFKELKSVESITVFITSGGGIVDYGIAIYDLLKSLNIPITTVAIGQCSSVATVIFAAGSKRYISKNCVYLLHSASISPHECDRINLSEVTSIEKFIRKENDKIIGLILDSKGINISLKKMKTIFSDSGDKIISAQEAVKYGFATEILKNVNDVI